MNPTNASKSQKIDLYSPFFTGLVFPLLNEMQKPHTHKLVNKQLYVQFDYKQFYVPLDSYRYRVQLYNYQFNLEI
jgi:hypothetical protein